jgi:iron complex outermembrane receptor protein
MNNRLGLMISMVLASLTAMPVLAQEADGALEEIMVTAQRREQNPQDVPVSITAFTGEQLERSNIKEASQYLNLSRIVTRRMVRMAAARHQHLDRGVSNINTDESAFIQSVGIYGPIQRGTT